VIVALLTDFGTRDHYVGAMKGVILSVCPDATLVDITHDIPAHDIVTGALELAAAYRYFPGGTVFLAVVDPGVGSSRRGIAAAAGGYRLVGPDNGVMSLVFRDDPSVAVVELREKKYARPSISRTFEGRDRFGPAAGWLARGTELGAFGPAVLDPVMLEPSQPTVGRDAIEGEVVCVDRFGNLLTNISQETLDTFGRSDVSVEILTERISGLVATYAEAAPLEFCALVGSSGRLEVALNGGSAANALKAGRGEVVRVKARTQAAR
jgi:S-adenosyl-L-methionine hydrolase (adenosine-forming)